MNTVCIHSILLLFMTTPQILVSSPNDAQGINSVTSYTPKYGWINDPTQLLHVCDYYIICYQYNNYSNQDGNISWGQAVSKDLVNWEDKDVVIAYNPQTKEQRFTGTGIVDQNNTSGLSKGDFPAVVAAFTNSFGQDTKLPDGSTVAAGTQSQYLAYILYPYQGRMYKMYQRNPIIKSPPRQYTNQSQNFRDPFLMWFEPQKKWIMVLALSDLFKVLIYSSENLINWTFLSEFSSKYSPRYQWECPGLFQVNEMNTNKIKWVLLVSTNPGEKVQGPGINPDRSATGSCVHYHVGHFDGYNFTEIKNKDGRVPYFDDGSDYYAANAFNNVGNRTLVTGWVNNWEYATNRTEEYKGALGFVREVFLLVINGVYRLIQRPVPELNKYVTQENSFTKSQMEAGIQVEIIRKQSHKFVITFKGTGNFALVLRDGQNYEILRIYNDYKNKTMCIQKKSVDPRKNGALVKHCAEYTAGSTTILTVIINRHSCTLLCDIGWPVFTELVKKILGKTLFKLDAGSSGFISGNHYILSMN